jgi:hypothetical protein
MDRGRRASLPDSEQATPPDWGRPQTHGECHLVKGSHAQRQPGTVHTQFPAACSHPYALAESTLAAVSARTVSGEELLAVDF